MATFTINAQAIISENISMSECKDAYSGETTASDCELIAEMNGNKVECTFKDMLVNCAYAGLEDIKVEEVNKVITLTLSSYYIVSCSCFLDFSLTLEGVEEGEYTVIVQQECTSMDLIWGNKEHNFKIEFKDGERTSDIEKIINNTAILNIFQINNIVKVNGDGKIVLSVYDLVGVKVAEASGDGKVSLSTDILPIGIYIVKATSDNGIETAEKKIVVK